MPSASGITVASGGTDRMIRCWATYILLYYTLLYYSTIVLLYHYAIPSASGITVASGGTDRMVRCWGAAELTKPGARTAGSGPSWFEIAPNLYEGTFP